MSALELEFLEQIREAGLPEPHREYMFMPGRASRFDFAWPDLMIAVEVEGGIYMARSRHTFPTTFEKDATKYNAAAVLGWMVLRLGPNQVRGRGRKPNKVYEGLDTLKGAMEARKRMVKYGADEIGNVVLEPSETSFTGWMIKIDKGAGVPASNGEVVLWRMLCEQSSVLESLRERVRLLESIAAVRRVADKKESS